MDNILEIKNLGIDVIGEKSSRILVDNVSFNVKKRGSLGIVGESGCGKSITALSIMQLLDYPLKQTRGQIIFEKDSKIIDLARVDKSYMKKVRGKEISMIFQEPMTALDPIFNIEYQIIEVLKFHTDLKKKDMKDKALEMLKKVGIPRAEVVMKNYPHQLSGGMLQRIVISMALICNPKLLIADEPTTALDVTIQAQILELINELRNVYETSVIMITHDLGVIAETCEDVIVFYAGQIVEETNVQELFNNTKHPYTKGLINSVTSLGDKTRPLYTIPGTVPIAGEVISGCKFVERCDSAMKICSIKEPDLIEVSKGHKCRCWLYDGRDVNE